MLLVVGARGGNDSASPLNCYFIVTKATTNFSLMGRQIPICRIDVLVKEIEI